MDTQQQSGADYVPADAAAYAAGEQMARWLESGMWQHRTSDIEELQACQAVRFWHRYLRHRGFRKQGHGRHFGRVFADVPREMVASFFQGVADARGDVRPWRTWNGSQPNSDLWKLPLPMSERDHEWLISREGYQASHERNERDRWKRWNKRYGRPAPEAGERWGWPERDDAYRWRRGLAHRWRRGPYHVAPDPDAAQRAARQTVATTNKCAEAYLPGNGPEHRGSRAYFQNFKAENPDAYDQWEKQRLHAEEHFESEVKDPAKQRTKDEAYIARVRAGTWPMHRVPFCDATGREWERQRAEGNLPNAVMLPKDPVHIRDEHVNSREQRIEDLADPDETGEHIAASNGHYSADEGVAAADTLHERPVWEALEQYSTAWDWHSEQGDPGDHGGHSPAWDWHPHDWTIAVHRHLDAQTDQRPGGKASIREELAAAKTKRTRERYPAIDRVLDKAERECGSDFAEVLVDEVRARYPDYLQHCLDKVAGYHRRGRHKAEPQVA